MTNEENKELEAVVENVTPAVEAAVETAASTEQVNYFAPEEEAEDTGRNERKTRTGLVASNKMDKTISVVIERRLQHPIYGKYVKKSKKLIAHDENNECQIGDLVQIMETRPLSRRKRWRLISILEKAK
jgi:ribosomal protein uS17